MVIVPGMDHNFHVFSWESVCEVTADFLLRTIGHRSSERLRLPREAFDPELLLAQSRAAEERARASRRAAGRSPTRSRTCGAGSAR